MQIFKNEIKLHIIADLNSKFSTQQVFLGDILRKKLEYSTKKSFSVANFYILKRNDANDVGIFHHITDFLFTILKLENYRHGLQIFSLKYLILIPNDIIN